MLALLLLLFGPHAVLLEVAFSADFSLSVKCLRHDRVIIMSLVNFEGSSHREITVFDFINGAFSPWGGHPVPEESQDSDVFFFGFGFAFTLVQLLDSIFELTRESIRNVYKTEAELLTKFE